MWVPKLMSVILFMLNLNYKIALCSNSGGSLVFVIDETFSMSNDMIDVKKQAKEILLLNKNARNISEFMLVSVTDPVVAVKSKTNSSVAFENDLSNIKASSTQNGNCEEPILAGIEKALEESRPGSFIYVITDASASDYGNVEKVASLSRSKQSPIMIMLLGECPKHINDNSSLAFYEIAGASGGQVLRIMHHQQLYTALTFFKLLLSSEYSAYHIQVFRKSKADPRDNSVKFNIDDNVDSMIVSVSGDKANFGLQFEQDRKEPRVEKIDWYKNLKVLKLLNPKAGIYKARVSANSVTSFVVYTRTGFTFEHGFCDDESKLIEATTTQPTTGKYQHLTINVTDPKNNVEIKSVQILKTNNQQVIKELPLRKKYGKLYITDVYKFPDYLFQIKVIAEIKNELVSKISKTVIHPNVTYYLPIITNENTYYDAVEGDQAVTIHCNVEGYPEPNIVWRNVTVSLENKFNYSVKENTLYITDLVASNETIDFECEAKNDRGVANKTFSVIVRDGHQMGEPNFYDITKNYLYVASGTNVTIPCGIINSNTRSVRWFLNGLLTIQTGNAYMIEDVSVFNSGNYTCRVNTNESTEVENYELNVGNPPKFQKEGNVNVVNWINDNNKLNCEATANPTQTVEWMHNGIKLESLSDISSIKVEDWGEYICNVSNIHGSIQKKFEVGTKGCYIRNNPDKRMPLIVDQETGTWPTGINTKEIFIEGNKTIELACVNNEHLNAFQSFPRETVITAQCYTQDKLFVDSNIYRYNDLQCKEPVEPSISNTHEQCAGPDTERIQVGFSVNGFVEAYTVCYDKINNVPLYANVHKSDIKRLGQTAASAFKWITVPGLGNTNTTGGYNCTTSEKCCYAKGQLLEVDAFPSGPAQAAAFTENMNSVAIWNLCDKHSRMSWRQFENKIKYEASNYFEWYTWTGASNYISMNGGLVPKYLWKMIKYEEDDNTIYSSMIYINEESPKDSDILCSKDCEAIISTEDKYTYCCSIDEFSKVFGITLDNFGVI